MDDLRPLVDDPDGSPLGRALLAAARADAPSPHARGRVARRLGIAAVLAAGAGAGSEAGALVVASKLTAVLLALGSVVGLAMWQSPALPDRTSHRLIAQDVAPTRADRVSGPEPRAPTASSSAPAPHVAADPAVAPVAAQPSVRTRAPHRPSAPRTTSQVPAQPPQAAPLADTSAPPTAEAPAEAPAAPAPAPADIAAEPAAPETVREVTAPTEIAGPEVAGPSRLAAEVALVDRARARLGAGDYPAALAALAEYHHRFANGDLDAEADMVMIEVLIARQDFPRARTLATAFFARFPRSPLAQRVHSLLDRLPK